MLIKDIGGEFGLIGRIKNTYSACQSPQHGLSIGIGDDAAVFDPAGRHVVVTTDMLVEDVHFRREWSDFYSIGWKSAAVNLSDIAGMGAVPTLAFVSLACNSLESVENLDRFYDGFVDCLTRYGARLAGGDTNTTPKNLVISITQLGQVAPGQAFTRSGARAGDQIIVTGSLGSSAAGLALLAEAGLPRAERLDKDLVNLHRRPQPRVVAALAAAATGAVHAAMDLSDGLAADLQKLCAASGVGARICGEAVPIAENVVRAARILNKDPMKWALQGGEDYELLLCVGPSGAETVKRAIEDSGVQAAVVGEIVKSGFHITTDDGRGDLELTAGWDHFRS